MVTSVAVVGARGRMGTLITRLVEESDDFSVHALLGSSDDLAGIDGADLVVDVTAPQVSRSVVEAAVSRGIPIVVGTSGWSRDRIASLGSLLGEKPATSIVIVPNFSLGSVLATRFSALAARFFDSIEIIEAHHEGKTDSPSGTAVRTAELMGEARRAIGPVDAPHVDQRARGQQVWSIPIHSLRMRGTVAEQEVRFGGTGESLRIVHETLSPASYEAGILVALRAAPSLTGIVVGLDQLLDLDGTADDARSDSAAGPAAGPANAAPGASS